MPRENFYNLLEISPSENDVDKIKAVIKKKQLQWSSQRSHPTKGRQAQQYLELIKEITKVMTTPKLRQAEAKAVHALLEEAEKEKFKELDEYIDGFSLKGKILPKELDKLASTFPNIPVEKIRSRIQVPIVQDDLSDGKKPNLLNKTTIDVIADSLKIIGKSSLYYFLDINPDASLTKIQSAIKKKDIEIKKVARKDAVITASTMLVGQCINIFKSSEMRQAYDVILDQKRLVLLYKAIEMAGTTGNISLEEYKHLLKKAVHLGLEEKKTHQYIKEYCTLNGIICKASLLSRRLILEVSLLCVMFGIIIWLVVQNPFQTTLIIEKIPVITIKPSPEKPKEINIPSLLAQCNTLTHLAKKVLCYQKILEENPENKITLLVLENLESHYIALIEGALKQQNVQEIKKNLAQLQIINPKSPQIVTFQDNLSTLEFSLLLLRCKKHFDEKRFTSGHENAATCYRQVLKIDPKHESALTHLKTMETHYISLIEDTLRCQKSTKTHQYITSLQTITPKHPKLEIFQKQLSDATRFCDYLKDESLGPEMVWIPAGTFKIGDLQGDGGFDEQPVHSISIKSFAMGKYEVTFAEYDKFATATNRLLPEDKGWGRANRPVINITWFDAVAYTDWLSKETGHTYRLPSEAEWEYACRAGTTTRYWWGNEIGKNKANCNGCGGYWDNKRTAPVGSFSANQFGLFDTLGNVREWTASKYETKYDGEEIKRKNYANFLVLRGGSWIVQPWYIRSANRGGWQPDGRYGFDGFRLVKEP